jgi:methionine-S-sulfoxide reductase
VSSGSTGHTESVEVTYDPTKVSYEALLATFWLNHDPTVKDRQFCDVGSQYRPSIFYHNPEHKRLAEASRAYWEKHKPFKEPIMTPIVAARAVLVRRGVSPGLLQEESIALQVLRQRPRASTNERRKVAGSCR